MYIPSSATVSAYHICDRICEKGHPACVYFKDAYLRNGTHDQNETWVVLTGGVTVVITRK